MQIVNLSCILIICTNMNKGSKISLDLALLKKWNVKFRYNSYTVLDFYYYNVKASV